MQLFLDISLKDYEVVQKLGQIKREENSIPDWIQCDNGSEFISRELDRFTFQTKVTFDYSKAVKPEDNPYFESFNGKFPDECLFLNCLF